MSMPSNTNTPFAAPASNKTEFIIRGLENLGAFTDRRSDEDGECSICKECYQVWPHFAVRIKSCRHVFGRGCLLRHVASNAAMRDRCPLCRTELFVLSAAEVLSDRISRRAGEREDDNDDDDDDDDSEPRWLDSHEQRGPVVDSRQPNIQRVSTFSSAPRITSSDALHPPRPPPAIPPAPSSLGFHPLSYVGTLPNPPPHQGARNAPAPPPSMPFTQPGPRRRTLRDIVEEMNDLSRVARTSSRYEDSRTPQVRLEMVAIRLDVLRQDLEQLLG